MIFVFGETTYYTISSSSTDCKIFPDGQTIILPGNSYTINIVPNAVTDTVGLTDNGTNVTSSLSKDKGLDKNGNTIASYSYVLSNVQENHDISVLAVPANSILYEKINGK